MSCIKFLRAFAAILAPLAILAGCASFQPPQYAGKITKIAEPIELSPVVEGKFAFSETSLTTTSVEFKVLGDFMTMTGTGTVRTEASAHSSITSAGTGYVMAIMFDRINARPVDGKADSEGERFEVEDLGYTGFLDGNGRVVALDVDVMSEGWLSMKSEHRQMVQEELDDWKKRRKREPVLPDIVATGDVIEVELDGRDLYPDGNEKLPKDFKVTGRVSYAIAGTTTFRDRRHLVLVMKGEIEGASKKERMNMSGEMGGFMLVDTANGDLAHWEQKVQVKVTIPKGMVSFREETQGDLTRR